MRFNDYYFYMSKFCHSRKFEKFAISRPLEIKPLQ